MMKRRSPKSRPATKGDGRRSTAFFEALTTLILAAARQAAERAARNAPAKAVGKCGGETCATFRAEFDGPPDFLNLPRGSRFTLEGTLLEVGQELVVAVETFRRRD